MFCYVLYPFRSYLLRDLNEFCYFGSLDQVHSLLEQHEQSLVPPMTPAAQPLPQQPLSTAVEKVPPQTPAPIHQLPEEQLPHMENMGYDVVSESSSSVASNSLQ
jgi:hypothetical protein